MKKDEVSRRRILAASACLPATMLVPFSTSGSTLACDGTEQNLYQKPAKLRQKPKNIIFMVSDGMSMGVPTLANPYSRLLREKPTFWTQLLKRPEAEHGFLETKSLNSLVTDSAAAASAWGGGQKVNNGSLNVLPDQSTLTPITELMKDNNKRTGLITTDKITGATPSGFAVVQRSRHAYEEIAPQFIDRVDVLLGGGRQYFEAVKRKDSRDLVAEYRAAGYRFCKNRDELNGVSSSDRILGLFADDTLPYTIDQLQGDAHGATPTLSELANIGMKTLAKSESGFFLMIEGARIDHAAHSNDAAAILHEQIAFEDAIEVAYQFTKKRDDTLLVVTSDHGNANPGLNGFGPGYSKTNDSFARLAEVKASFGAIRTKIRDAASIRGIQSAAKDVLFELCGVRVKDDVALIVGEALISKKLPNELAILQRSWVGVLSQVLGNYTGIGFTGTNHTADRTMITAIGPGAKSFSGVNEHTDIFRNFLELATYV